MQGSMGYEPNVHIYRKNSHVRVARHRSDINQVGIEGLLLALLLFLREECRCVRHFARQFGALTLLGRGSGWQSWQVKTVEVYVRTRTRRKADVVHPTLSLIFCRSRP